MAALRLVIDASVLVSWFHRADPFHQASRAWLRQHLLAGGQIYAPWLLQSEVAGALTRRTGDQALGARAARWVRSLPELHLVALDAAVGQRAADLAVGLRLRGADAVYVAVADQLQLSLVTWDREQRERGGNASPPAGPIGPV
jgi:predicted nucleic acid-binding protein